MKKAAPVTTHLRACSLCEAICGLRIEVADGEVLSIRGDEDDFFSRGHVCPKALALKDIQEDPDRIRQPMKRLGTRWEPVSWQQAFKEIAARAIEIRTRHGDDSLAFYRGNPIGHNYGLITHYDLLVNHLPTKHLYSSNSVDGTPVFLVAYWMYGHMILWPVPDVDRTDHMVILGANPLASNGSAMTAPGIERRLRAIRERGGRVVLIDPRRTETARVADEHHFIRPGTDAALMAAMLHTIFEEGLARPGRLAPYLHGLDRVAERLRPVTPERAATVTGIPAETIRRLARDLASAERGIFYARMGVAVQEFATLSNWLAQLLNVATGNLDQPGGIMWPTPAVPREPTIPRGEYGTNRTRLRGLPSFANELPVATLAEEILTGDSGQVRGLFTVAGNPVLSTPNGRQLDEALSRLDLMVSVDIYLNETTRHAHYLLPSPTPLEHDHYNLFFYNLSVRDLARYCAPVLLRPEGTLDDWEIFAGLVRALRRRVGAPDDPIPSSREMLDQALRSGPYGDSSPHRLSLEALERSRHGIDLGLLKPRIPGGLATDDGKVHCAPENLLADLDRLERTLLRNGDGKKLVVIGRRELRGNNSWMHNYPRLMKGEERCVLLVHPRDLEARGLRDGDEARVRSSTGEIVVPVKATEDMMPGVTCLPHGYGHGRPGVRLGIASSHPGASLNDLADDRAVDPVSGNAVLNGIPIEILPLVSKSVTAGER